MKHSIGAAELRAKRQANDDLTRGLGKADTDRVLSSLEDHVEAFTHLAIVEFLNKKGFRRTATMYNNEAASVAATRPTDKSWYEVSAALDIPSLMRENEKRGNAHETVLEILVDHIRAKRERAIRKQAAAAVAEADDTPVAGGGQMLSTDPLNDFAFAEPAGDAESRGRSAYSPISSDAGGSDYSPDRYGASSRRRGGGGGDGGAMGGTGRSKRSGAGSTRFKKSASDGFTSVSDLEKRLARAQQKTGGGQKASGSPKRGKGTRSTPSFPTVGGAARRKPVPRKLSSTVSDPMGGSLTPGDVNGHTQPSNVRWMPLQGRLRMLKRDLDLLRVNAAENAKYEMEKHKRESTISDLEQEKMKDKYSGKKKKHCALCEHIFAQMNLPLAISLKAVVDLRMSWGVPPAHPRMVRPPYCYDMVRVCVFCAQFFDESHSYRLDDGPMFNASGELVGGGDGVDGAGAGREGEGGGGAPDEDFDIDAL